MTLRHAALLALVAATTAQAQDHTVQSCRRLADPAARLACYDAIPVESATPASAASSPQLFGLPAPAPAELVDEIRSAVGPEFTGWEGRTQIVLANGQVWEVIDSSTGIVGPANRKVTVRRAALGSFRIEFEGLNRSPRVRRVR